MHSSARDVERETLLEVRGLATHYPVGGGILGRNRGVVHAVDGVDLALRRGETLALVGESGCGKSTLARTLVRLQRPTAGRIVFDGRDVTRVEGRGLRDFRRRIQLVFQDPYTSLNPRLTARQLVAEPLRVHDAYEERGGAARVDELLERLGIALRDADKLPSQFSGGQRQRIAIARALALQPEVIVLDEPVAALDVSIQAQILNLLADLQSEMAVTYLFISHDLAVVRQVADRLAVMYLGKVVETGPADQVYERPSHPYTNALLSAVPVADPRARGRRERIILRGDVPNPLAPPSGCRFRTRCWKAEERCAAEAPELEPAGAEHRGACHFPVGPAARAEMAEER